MTLIDDLIKYEKEMIETAEMGEKILKQLTKPGDSMRDILNAKRLRENHIMKRGKLFEVYGVIEQLVKDDKGERIVELCRHLDDIVRDYNNRGNLTHVPLIELFKMLIKRNIKGHKLLALINYTDRDAVNLAKLAIQEPDHFDLLVKEVFLTPEQIKERADQSLAKCLEVI